MKRPLLWIVVAYVFGIILLYSREAGQPGHGMFMPPDLCVQLEATEEEISGTLQGRIRWLFEREEQILLILDTDDPAIGTVRVYLDEYFSSCELLPGDQISLKGRFFLFPTADNPGEFDTRAYFDHLRQYLGFSASDYTCLSASFTPKKPVFRLLKKACLHIDAHAEEAEKGAIKAILTGNQSLLSEETEDLYTAAGVLYLLSASGFLISSLGLSLYGSLRKRIGNVWVPILISVTAMAALTVFTGSTVSVIRAFLIFSIRIMADLFQRVFDLLSAAACAFLFLLFENAQILFLPAVWYYLAVLFALGILAPSIESFLFYRRKGYHSLIRLLSIQLCLLPVSVFVTCQTSLYGIFTAAVFFGIRSLMFLLTAAAALLGSPFLFTFLSRVLFAEKDLFSSWIQVPGVVWITGKPDAIRLLLYGICVVMIALICHLLFLKRKRQPEAEEHVITVWDHRIVSAVLIFVYVFGLFYLRAPSVPAGETAVRMLYVGQGDGILIQDSESTYLIDCGSTSSDTVGRDVLLPALRYFGVRKLDTVFLTHDDLDHTNGVRYLLENGTVPIEKICIAETAFEQGDFQWIPEEKRCLLSAGDNVGCFTVLSPGNGDGFEKNDGSLVLDAAFPGGTAIFTGDITEDAEAKIRSSHAYDLLKIAHHGSRFSSSETFLTRVQPKIAVVSYGRKNPYGHPTEEALTRVKNTGAAVYRTGEDGCITVRFLPDHRIFVQTFHPHQAS